MDLQTLLLIYQGHITEGCIIIASMVGFFVGEKNGAKGNSSKT